MDWLRTKTDQQLLEHKASIDKLIADLPRVPGTQTPEHQAVRYIAEYLYRTAGFERALEFINSLDRELPGGTFNLSRFQFLSQHERTDELEAYIQELNQRQINHPLFTLLCLKYFLSQGQHQRAESLLSRFITDHPQSAHIVEAIALATVFGLGFDRAGFEQKVRWGGKFLALESQILGAADAEAPPVVHCINMDRSPQRMARCTDLYRDKAELHRIPGMPGDALPGYLLGRVTINPALPRSAIGCTLSHIAAWERIAENDESSPPEIIAEDDGLPLLFSRAACSVTQNLVRQQKLDLLYIHEAASPLLFTLREFSPQWKPEALPFQIGLGRFIRHQKKLPGGWGTCGYYLSVTGARKLLVLLERDGLTNHIDWQTFLYSATDWDHPVVHSKKNVAVNYRRTTGRAPRRELNSGILNYPMIAQTDFTQSTR